MQVEGNSHACRLKFVPNIFLHNLYILHSLMSFHETMLMSLIRCVEGNHTS